MPGRRKDLLLDLMHVAADGKAGVWHASLLAALEGVDATRARWRPAPDRPSIWDLVRHVTHWKRGLMRAWDEGELDTEAWSAQDWSGPAEEGGEEAWRESVDELARVTRGLASRLAAADERLLDAEVGGFGGGVARHAMQAATHDAYHAGQVRLLLRLQAGTHDARAASEAGRGEDG